MYVTVGEATTSSVTLAPRSSTRLPCLHRIKGATAKTSWPHICEESLELGPKRLCDSSSHFFLERFDSKAKFLTKV